MDFGNNGVSRGAVGAALGTGIAGLSLGVLNGLGGLGGLGGLLGNPAGAWAVNSDNIPVNRYEMAQERKISELEAAVALRDSNTFTDQKMLEMYRYIDGKLGGIDERLCHQAVHNQRTEDAFALVRQDIGAVRADLDAKIKLESERRCCADGKIVGYVNGTFYPKSIADVTVGTTTTQALLYNPLGDCGCC